ncbi:ATP-dependent helicase HrpA [Motilibacter peucedani]|uniref:RNA helicase n=1 Tax=Motilibacter peucedani TaxID=598650 RepID=A0A420XKD0_9ACTN|nr:ATP-dependent RNA helicase HrpA [Motilibacter peucedani]RKS67975.1 ATP-dependent helicase HrpA [Motilibacter peucedani]
MASVHENPVSDLQTRVRGLATRDARRLQRRLDGARRVRDAARRTGALDEVAKAVASAEQRLADRAATVPVVRYPDLPVSQRRDDILAAIRDNQVVIVAGETGSGKTTQLPKMCLELGRGVRGTIGHTQPRRIAARAVAERIAEELGQELGESIGFKVRFTDRGGSDSLVKVMTDGILLAELQNDRDLLAYDTIIIDEAHERSLNIDFLLGYLKQLLPRRPDLKVVVTSATIDTERFSQHFDGAPVVEVSGRTFPVETRYRPLVESADDDDAEGTEPRDLMTAIGDAVQELSAEGPGDILVFLSGEREIRDAADALGKLDLRFTEILPLYARLSAAEQHRVFSSHTGRRVVLATNVAETSLTVPGIRYVVDPGTARISRYSSRLKVQRLPIEPVSQASANQRKGRCGRVEAGVCIRLYSEADFDSRPEFTDPEILRTNLASVILQMTALGLGEIERFPFVEPPDSRQVRDGVALLEELGALGPGEGSNRTLTDVGRRLAALPLDPRLGRMVLEAERNGCLREVMVVTAALSIQDPRERPVDKQQAADEKHARFADKESDFASILRLWDYVQEQQDALSSSAFRRLCRSEFLNYLRVREWQDVFSQLRQTARSIGLARNEEPADPQRVHLSLLAGLLSHLGLRDASTRDYQGARGARFALWPGSALARKQPQWVMAAELVETSRLFGRVAAKIEPEWAEKLAEHLVKRTYSEPHWSKDRAAVMAYERVLLYGLPLVAQRRVGYSKVDPQLCREMFIRHALVEGDWRTHHAFFEHNRSLLAEAGELEHRVRRRGLVVSDDELFDFYDTRVGKDVVSGRHFDSWWKKTKRDQPDLLTFTPEMLVSAPEGTDVGADYPDAWRQGDLVFPLTYSFEPGTADDGVTAQIPIAALNRVRADDFDWQVPGLREQVVTELIRSLPKAIRRSFVPAPNYAAAVLPRMVPRKEPLLDALERELESMAGVPLDRGDWDLSKLPGHLRMTFVVVDDKGKKLGEGKDLAALRAKLAPSVQATLSRAGSDLERSGLTDWPGGVIPGKTTEVLGGLKVEGFPSLVDEGATVALRVLSSAREQHDAMPLGTRRLLLLSIPSPVKPVVSGLSNSSKLVLARSPHGSVAALLDDCTVASVDELVRRHGGPAWDEPAFRRLRDAVRADLADTVLRALGDVEQALDAVREAESRLRRITSVALLPALSDVQRQLSDLVFNGFVTATGLSQLPHLPRYLRAVTRRLERLPDDPRADAVRMAQVARARQLYDDRVAKLPRERHGDPDVVAVRWMLEELRVSLFAQQLGTPTPVSEQRIAKAVAALRPSSPQG